MSNYFGIKFKDIFDPGTIGEKIGSKLGSGVSVASNSKLTSDIETQKYISENQPTWNMTGLQNAGLNPALAAGGNLTSSPSSPTLDTAAFTSAVSVIGKLANTAIQGAMRMGNSAVGVAGKAAAA